MSVTTLEATTTNDTSHNHNTVPRIVTELPGPKAKEYLALSAQYEPHSMSEQVPCVWAKAEGATVTDVDGNTFIDFSSGVLVMNVGHCHPQHVAEIREQAGLVLNAYDFVTPPRVELAKKLVEITPPNLDKAIILTTGTETIEAAVKMARRFTGRQEIVSFYGGFHGRTFMSMSVGGKMGVKKGFGPMVPGVMHAPFPDYYRPPVEGMTEEQVDRYCLEQLDLLLDTVSTGEVAAVLTETYQGAAGSRVPSKRFMQGLQAWCEAHDALFIIDEVQASFGRTGTMFGFEQFDITPNLLCLGKGISCGVPCSAVVGEARIMNALEPGSISSTNGGNPLSSRAALASIRIIEEERLSENAAKVGDAMMQRCKRMQERSPILGDVRGMGLSLGLEFVKDKRTKEPAPDLTKRVIDACYRNGLLLIAPIGFHGNVIRISPPLVISEELAQVGMDILESVVSEPFR